MDSKKLVHQLQYVEGNRLPREAHMSLIRKAKRPNLAPLKSASSFSVSRASQLFEPVLGSVRPSGASRTSAPS
jgi:hypothetical protein